MQLKDSKAGKGMFLTDRDRRIVRDVTAFRLLTREQLQRLGHFRSKTRGNAVLSRLSRFGYLSRRYQPAVAGTKRPVYLPGPQAAQILNVDPIAVHRERKRVKGIADLFLDHHLLVCDVRISFRRYTEYLRWHNEQGLRAFNLGLVPDGHIEYARNGRTFGAFIEADRGTETLNRWSGKVDAYLKLALSGSYTKVFGRQFFRVLVVCPSSRRLEHLRATTTKLTDKIFWFTTIDNLQTAGPLSTVWLRPSGSELHSLTES